MPKKRTLFFIIFIVFFTSPASSAEKTVIASNGASKGLIEHTLTAVTLAATTDLDYLELHVVMTADNQLIVFRDLTLNRLTDVATVFPERNREDGGFYPVDFNLSEIRQLRLRNVFANGSNTLSLPIPTLSEELSLIRFLEHRLDKKIGIALEIKYPWFHTKEGKAISEATLDTVALFGYGVGDDKLYLQCFDPEELQRIDEELLPTKQLTIPLIQLIGENDGTETKQQALDRWIPYNYDWLFTNIGMRVVTSYAAAVALPVTLVSNQNGELLLNQYIEKLHQYGLQVFVYPVDNNPETLPSFADNFQSLLDFFYSKGKIDGIYTDSYTEALNFEKYKNKQVPEKSTLPSFFSHTESSEPAAGNAVNSLEGTLKN